MPETPEAGFTEPKRNVIKIPVIVIKPNGQLSLKIVAIDSSFVEAKYRFEETIGAIKVRTGYRPIRRPEEIVADSIYDDAQAREYLHRRRIKASIPENKRNRKKGKRGRPRRFSKELYTNRTYAVELKKQLR